MAVVLGGLDRLPRERDHPALAVLGRNHHTSGDGLPDQHPAGHEVRVLPPRDLLTRHDAFGVRDALWTVEWTSRTTLPAGATGPLAVPTTARDAFACHGRLGRRPFGMGSYANCWLGPLNVSWSKNEMDPMLTWLFRASDKRVVPCVSGEVPQVMKDHWLDARPEPHDDLYFVFYEAPISVVRDRLEVLGYTLETALAVFEAGRTGEIQAIQRRGVAHDFQRTELEFLRALSVDRWLDTLRRMAEGEAATASSGRSTLPPGPRGAELNGFPSPDSLAELRLAFEAVPDAERLVYDISDLVWAGYLGADDEIVGDEIIYAEDQAARHAKTIVLVEGRSDSWILDRSLRLLYPHLHEYFSFMNFDVARPPGGVGNLANLVRAFAAAGVANRIIALFDNDTAGHEAVRGLEGLAIPQRYKTCTLPDTTLLRHYPTIGPSGMQVMDVNRLAGAIELYLGRDVLTQADGTLSPVQWTGYSARMGRYHGEVMDKERIKRAFLEKLAASEQQHGRLEDDERWVEMRGIIQMLLATFHEYDQATIVAEVEQYYGK